MAPTTASPLAARRFEVQAADVIQRLRAACCEIVQAVAGARAERPARLAEILEVDPGLGYKLHKIVESEDPFAAARYIPGAGGARILIRAARKKGVAAATVTRAEQVFQEYQRIISVHAENRRSFNMLLAAHVISQPERAEIEHRKAAFEHLSYVWGVQARTQVRVNMLYPSADARCYDAVAIRGFVDLCRIRPNVPWRIGTSYTVDDAGIRRASFERMALEPPEAESIGLPLMRRFCSQPVPSFRRTAGNSGMEEYLIEGGTVGNASKVNCFCGELIRAAEPRYRDDLHRELVICAKIQTPCETFIFDLLIHTHLLENTPPQLNLFSRLFKDGPEECRLECDRLPACAEVQNLGRGTLGILAPEVPRYAEMMNYAFERIGWDPGEFRHYRVRLAYPPVPVDVTLTQPLPPSPGPAPTPRDGARHIGGEESDESLPATQP